MTRNLIRVCAVDWRGNSAAISTTTPAAATTHRRRLGGVHGGLLLRLADVLLVADALVAEPVAHLAHADAALARQLLLGLLGRIRIAQVRIEVGVEYLLGLLGEVAALAARVQEARAQYHHRLARALLELHLDGAELAAYDVHHAVDLFGRDGSRLRLVLEQVDCVRGELVALVFVHLQLVVVDLAYVLQLDPVVGVLESERVGRVRAATAATSRPTGRSGRLERIGSGTAATGRHAGTLRAGDALCHEHVVESSYLRILLVVVHRLAHVQRCLLLQVAQHLVQGRLDAVTLELFFSIHINTYKNIM